MICSVFKGTLTLIIFSYLLTNLTYKFTTTVRDSVMTYSDGDLMKLLIVIVNIIYKIMQHS